MSATVASPLRFDHFRVLTRPDGFPQILGEGAMGTTYRAINETLGSIVALKVIKRGRDSERARQRFSREARLAALLSHSNIARVFHLGETERGFYYVMEYCRGITVQQYVNRHGPFSLRDAIIVTSRVARALEAATQKSLIHRDIKPSNIMLVRESEFETEVKVIDFGLAKFSAGGGIDEGDLEEKGFVGTFAYSSPEQLRESELDFRSDLYSLGVTFWFMLTGKPTFHGKAKQIIESHLRDDPDWSVIEEAIGKDHAKSIVPILRRILAKDRDDRFQNFAALQHELLQALAAVAPDRGYVGEFFLPKVAERDMDSDDTGLPAGTGVPLSGEGSLIDARFNVLELTESSSMSGGSFCRTARAFDHAANREVSLIILEGQLGNEDRQSLETLIRKRESLRHPSLRRIYAFRPDHFPAYLAQEWVNGFSIQQLLQARSALSFPEASHLLQPLAEGMDHLVAEGLDETGPPLRDVMIHFEAEPDVAAQLKRPLREWPPHKIKISLISADDILASMSPSQEALDQDLFTVVADSLQQPESFSLPLHFCFLLKQIISGKADGLPGGSGHFRPLSALKGEGNAYLEALISDPAACREHTCNQILSALCYAEGIPLPGEHAYYYGEGGDDDGAGTATGFRTQVHPAIMADAWRSDTHLSGSLPGDAGSSAALSFDESHEATIDASSAESAIASATSGSQVLSSGDDLSTDATVDSALTMGGLEVPAEGRRQSLAAQREQLIQEQALLEQQEKLLKLKSNLEDQRQTLDEERAAIEAQRQALEEEKAQREAQMRQLEEELARERSQVLSEQEKLIQQVDFVPEADDTIAPRESSQRAQEERIRLLEVEEAIRKRERQQRRMLLARKDLDQVLSRQLENDEHSLESLKDQLDARIQELRRYERRRTVMIAAGVVLAGIAAATAGYYIKGRLIDPTSLIGEERWEALQDERNSFATAEDWPGLLHWAVLTDRSFTDPEIALGDGEEGTPIADLSAEQTADRRRALESFYQDKRAEVVQQAAQAVEGLYEQMRDGSLGDDVDREILVQDLQIVAGWEIPRERVAVLAKAQIPELLRTGDNDDDLSEANPGDALRLYFEAFKADETNFSEYLKPELEQTIDILLRQFQENRRVKNIREVVGILDGLSERVGNQVPEVYLAKAELTSEIALDQDQYGGALTTFARLLENYQDAHLDWYERVKPQIDRIYDLITALNPDQIQSYQDPLLWMGTVTNDPRPFLMLARTEPNLQEKYSHYQEAAKYGSSVGLARLGKMNLEYGVANQDADYIQDGLQKLNQAAQAEEPVAFYELGNAYFAGQGVERDMDEAYMMGMMSANNGVEDGRILAAKARLWQMEDAGRAGNIPQATEYKQDAIRQLNLAIDAGLKEAYYYLYTAHYSVNELVDLDAARQALERGVEARDPNALWAKGRVLRFATGGAILEPDYGAGRALILAAAELGHPPAIDWCRRFAAEVEGEIPEDPAQRLIRDGESDAADWVAENRAIWENQ